MEADRIKVSNEEVMKILECDALVDQNYPSDPCLQQCYVCEESKTSGLKWHKGLGLDTLVSHYEEHAHMEHFKKNRQRIQAIQDPLARSRYLPWHKNYSPYCMEENMKKYLHAKYKKVRDRVEKINKAMAGLSSESVSGTEDSSSSSEQHSSHDFSKPSSSDEHDDNLGFAPSEVQSKSNPDPDDEIALFKTQFLETEDEKHKRMCKNPPNPCKEGGKFCTKFETKEQARYHYHLYHSKLYRPHNCSRDPSCGRRFHEESDARDHNCHAHVLEYISPKKKSVFIEDQRMTRSRNDSGKIKRTSSTKRRPSPSLKEKQPEKHRKKKKKHRLIISDSDDDDAEDPERDNLIKEAQNKRKDNSKSHKPSSLTQRPAEERPSRPKKDVIDQIDLTKLDLNLENLSDNGDFGHIVSGNITATDIRQSDSRFCPICSKDRIPADKLREHVKNCLTNSSKIYNTFISTRG